MLKKQSKSKIKEIRQKMNKQSENSLKNKKFLISEQDKGKRLDIFLLEQNPEFSRSYIKNLILNEKILHNGQVKKSGTILKQNDIIEMEIPENIKPSSTPENLPLDIIFEDDHLAVINKNQGVVVHAGNGNPNGTLVNALLYHIKDLSGINGVLRPGIVHRLDKNTSGILLVAKNDKAHRNLAEQISNKTCKRKYLAILEGNIKQDAGIIETNITRNPRNRTLMMTSYDLNVGKKAITEYKVLERFDNNCLVEFNLKTGRTHQIRVHCKEVLHHSIVGDIEYGGSICKLIPKTAPKSLGQYLHAYKIEFTHPISKKILTFEAPLPPHFHYLLEKLRDLSKN